MTFASELTSYRPVRLHRPSPPSTLPPPIAGPSTPAPPTPSPKRHHHHHHHRHHHRCKKHDHDHAHRVARDKKPDRREKEVIVQDVVAISEAVARRQRRLDAGVSKRRTPIERRRGESKKKTSTDPQRESRRDRAGPSTAAGKKARNETSSRREKERASGQRNERTDRKPLKETTSRTTQVLGVSVEADNGGRRAHREIRESRESKDTRERREDGKEERGRREGREPEDEERRKSKRISSSDELRRVRRSVARRLQLSRDDLSYSLLEPVHASVLYELYVKTKGEGEEDEKLKKRMEAQEKREGRSRGSRKQRQALAKLVGVELGRDVEEMRQLPRRMLVERYVVDAGMARMERLRNRKKSGGAS